MKRLFTLMLDKFCGQPDMLRNSRSLALRELLAKPVEVEKPAPRQIRAESTVEA